MMGAGIAYACARAGMEVVLKDVSIEAAEKGKAHSAKLLDKQVERGRIDDRQSATRSWPASSRPRRRPTWPAATW